MFAVGIGKNYRKSELVTITGSEDRVLDVKDFTLLSQISKPFYNAVNCKYLLKKRREKKVD
jgi:hypothetical protein